MSYKTNYNSDYNANDLEQEPIYPEGSIILLVHGLFSPADGMQEFSNTIMGLYPLKDYYNLQILENPSELATNNYVYITENDDRTSNVYNRINDAFTLNPKANILVKVNFKDDKYGTIDDQTSELRKIVSNLKDEFTDKSIVTVGHSKGGIVSMNCAIELPGKIDKLISIGTPYTTTFVDQLLYFMKKITETKFNKTIDYIANMIFNEDEIEYHSFAVNVITDGITVAAYSYLNKYVTKLDLKKRWNQLETKPKFTPIATRALVIDDKMESDLIVPVESALANGFDGKSYSNEFLLVKDEPFKIKLYTNYYTGAFNLPRLLRLFNDITSNNISVDLLTFLTSVYNSLFNATQNSDYIKRGSARYLHAYFEQLEDYFGSSNNCLNNPDVALKVLAGLLD